MPSFSTKWFGRGPMTNERMIAEQIEARGVRSPRVLAAMRNVDRALFVPAARQSEAYADAALPTTLGQTISQPYIVGLMTELLDPQPADKVLEIGTGTGYQTAILARLCREVWSIERLPSLADEARSRLERLGYANVHVLCGDGYAGLPGEAPFQRIMVTAAPPEEPETLRAQLAVPGRMVVPLGETEQELIVIQRIGPAEYSRRVSIPVRFVPMVHGTAGPSAT